MSSASGRADFKRATIHRLTELPDWRRRLRQLDPIFFEASLTKTFADDVAREAFRERWLGRFLDRWPGLAHVAVTPDGAIVGYIVGAHADPARSADFADVGFYAHLGELTPHYPAHLHINLAAEARGLGIGSALIDAFVADVRGAGLPGVHLVTGRHSRNRSFYARNGFEEIAGLDWAGTAIVMLGRSFAATERA
jgi:GNAT superfamily N-acetyltransferase